MQNKGTIAQVLGPIVDVEFKDGKLPAINDALTVQLNGAEQVMEVAQHVGGNTVRCIMLSPSEGLGRGVEVTASGAPIEVPVGEKCLGRMFNVLGHAIDGREEVTDSEKWSIHREPPNSWIRAPWFRFRRPASRSSTCWPPTPAAVRSACSAARVLARPC